MLPNLKIYLNIEIVTLDGRLTYCLAKWLFPTAVCELLSTVLYIIKFIHSLKHLFCAFYVHGIVVVAEATKKNSVIEKE